MRVVWKDTSSEKKTKMYRGYKVYGANVGWCIEYPGDNNIYKSWTDAFNAIDNHLGGRGRKGVCRSHKNRQTGEVRILGTVG